jgi:hypothetical protein
VGVAWNGSDGDYEDFVDRHGLTFPQLADTSGAVFERFQIPFQPAFAIVPVDGEAELLIGAARSPVLDMIISDALRS